MQLATQIRVLTQTVHSEQNFKRKILIKANYKQLHDLGSVNYMYSTRQFFTRLTFVVCICFSFFNHCLKFHYDTLNGTATRG